MADDYLIDLQTKGQETVDWSVVTLPFVEEDILMVAARLATRYDNIADVDDLVQEAYLWAAEHPSQVRDYVDAGHRGEFRNRLSSRLTTKVAREARIQSRQIPYNRLYENDGE